MADKPEYHPAFPQHDTASLMLQDARGMSLRDYFAAKAMVALIYNDEKPNPDIIAQASFVVADAMLKARQS